MNQDLKSIIRAFQTDVQRALVLFRKHANCDNLLSWRESRRPLSGYLDSEQQYHYSFHGVGVRVQLAPDLHIDWDFGHGGRMDGFDLWRIQQFLEERPELRRVMTFESLRSTFDAAVRDGSIISPWRGQHDRLYYIADDLQNVRDS